MNKNQLVEAVALESGLPKAEVRKMIESFVVVANEALTNGDKIMISGFGTLYVTRTAPRVGRNPHTGAVIKIPSKNVVKFRYANSAE